MTYLGEGDLAGARERSSQRRSKEVEPTALVAYLREATTTSPGYSTTSSGTSLLRLTPAAFDDDRGAWGIGPRAGRTP